MPTKHPHEPADSLVESCFRPNTGPVACDTCIVWCSEVCQQRACSCLQITRPSTNHRNACSCAHCSLRHDLLVSACTCEGTVSCWECSKVFASVNQIQRQLFDQLQLCSKAFLTAGRKKKGSGGSPSSAAAHSGAPKSLLLLPSRPLSPSPPPLPPFPSSSPPLPSSRHAQVQAKFVLRVPGTHSSSYAFMWPSIMRKWPV